MKKNKNDKDVRQNESEDSFDQFDELRKQAKEYLAGWQRAQADYKNLKNEMEIKMASISSYAKGALLIEFLPILINLNSAFDHIPRSEQDKDWALGFSHIKKQLEDFLQAQGLEKIKTVGQQFDHDLYEAVDTGWQADKQPGEILQEVTPGYKLENKVLIHPKVVVNRQAESLDGEKK